MNRPCTFRRGRISPFSWIYEIVVSDECRRKNRRWACPNKGLRPDGEGGKERGLFSLDLPGGVGTLAPHDHRFDTIADHWLAPVRGTDSHRRASGATAIR